MDNGTRSIAVRSMIVESAFISGVMFLLVIPTIRIGNVVEPGPDVKLVIT
jgi:hypothetical protein